MDKRDGKLRRISQTKLTVKVPEQDVRGRTVVDRTGTILGVVDDLLIDDREETIRFLCVASGGFFGIGATRRLIPTGAIVAITVDAVRVDRAWGHVASGKGYDVALTTAPDYRGELYAYYGYAPVAHPNDAHLGALDLFREDSRKR